MPDYDTQHFESCSPEVKAGFNQIFKWLDDVEELDPGLGSTFYALNQINHDLVGDYIQQSKDSTEQFWIDSEYRNIVDYKYPLWFSARLHKEAEAPVPKSFQTYIESLEDAQQINGRFLSEGGTAAYLLILNIIKPDSLVAKRSNEYFVENWRDEVGTWLDRCAFGILALTEKDYHEYKDTVKKLAEHLVSQQSEDGYFGDLYWRAYSLEESGNVVKRCKLPLEETAFAILALSRLDKKHQDSINKSINWLKTNQLESGSWSVVKHEVVEASSEEVEFDVHGSFDSIGELKNNAPKYSDLSNIEATSNVLCALCSTSAGPTIPKQRLDWETEIKRQKMNRVKSTFHATIPSSGEGQYVREIRGLMEQMIEGTEDELLIISPYIDLLHEKIIDLSSDNPDIDVQIITRPKGEFAGSRKRIGKAAVEQLNRSQYREVRTNLLAHSRLVLKDEEEILVSSADLTRAQLVDEFNAGIHTADEEVIESGKDFFGKVWEESDSL